MLVVSSDGCIYCGALLGPDTREAHVIPSALGGKLSSRRICCSGCNNAVSGIENGLCRVLRGLTAMAGVRTGRGKKAPSLLMADPQHGPLEAWGGHPKFLGTPPKVQPRHDGQVRFKIFAADLDSAAFDMAHLLRRLGKTPDDLEAGRLVTLTASERITFLDHPWEFDASFDVDEHARVFVKMALELLAVHRPVLARRPELRDLAAFVRSGAGSVNVSADTMTPGPLGTMRPFWRSCEVWSAGRDLIAKVALFGAYSVSVALTPEWRGEPVTAAQVVDPVAGQVLFDGAFSAEGPLPSGWPERGLDLAAYQVRMTELARALDARMREVTAKTSAKALMETWTADLRGRAPSPEDFARLETLVEEKCERLRGRRSETVPIDTADLFRRVRHHYERLEREHGPALKR